MKEISYTVTFDVPDDVPSDELTSLWADLTLEWLQHGGLPAVDDFKVEQL